MKNIFFFCLIILAFASISFAQQTDANSLTDAQMSQTEQNAAKFSAELLDTIDVEKSKRSDGFQIKLNEDLKIGDKTLDKGTKINGRVVRSQKISKDNDTSLLSLYLGSVQEKDGYFRFNARIISVTDSTQASGGEMEFSTSPNFQGATIIKMKGKNLRFEKGATLQMQLDQPAN